MLNLTYKILQQHIQKNIYILRAKNNVDEAVLKLLQVRKRQRAVRFPHYCACVRLLRAFATSASPQPRSRRSVRLCASVLSAAMKNLHLKDFFWVSVSSAEFGLILGSEVLIEEEKKKKRLICLICPLR